MATSLATLIERLGRTLGDLEFDTTTTAAGASDGTTAVVGRALAQSAVRDSADERFDDTWLALPSGPSGSGSREERRVSDYTPTSGTFTVTPVFSAQVASGAAIELHRLASRHTGPLSKEQAINDVLEQLEYVDRRALTIVDDARQYTISTSFSDLTDPKQLIEVWKRLGDTANEYTYRRMAWWRAYQDASDVILEIQPQVASTTLALEIEYKRPYTTLTTDAATTPADPLWVTWNAAAVLLERLLATAPPQEADRGLAALLARAQQQASRLNQRWQPRAVRRWLSPWGAV